MSLTENRIDFKRFEEEIYKMVCGWGCELMKQALERYDDSLMLKRDRTIYRHKGPRKTAIKTIMGTVEYQRGVYQRKNEDGTKSFVYLLDEAMGKEGSGYMSELLSEQIVKAACEGPFRNAARAVSEMTGQTISHTAAWNVVQDIGNRIDKKEQQAAEMAERNQGTGELETKILFEEQDGIWLKLQGKSRKEHGAGHEMKVAIAYDGFAPCSPAKKSGKRRYRLTNKIAYANFGTVNKFQKRKEGIIASTYNVDEIETRVVNGDGAIWIKNAIIDENTHFQLDPFHRNQAVIKHVKNLEMRKQIFKLLYDNKIDDLLEYIEALSNSVYEEEERENLLTLLTYFTNNKEGLIPWQRRGLKTPQESEEKEYHNMGAMESNIFTIIGNRMKGGRKCWSINGGNNLASLLCLRATNKLSETLKNLTSVVLPQKYEEEIISVLSSSKVAKTIGKGYNGYSKSTVPPIPKLKWLKDIFSLKPFSEIYI
jgi:hypothetical protein